MVSPKIYVGSRRVAPATLSAPPPPPSTLALVTWTLCFKTDGFRDCSPGAHCRESQQRAGQTRYEGRQEAGSGGGGPLGEKKKENSIHQAPSRLQDLERSPVSSMTVRLALPAPFTLRTQRLEGLNHA